MNYFDIYRSVWDFHKRFSLVKEGEFYWDFLMAESQRIAETHGNSEFVISLLTAVVCELDRTYREMKANEEMVRFTVVQTIGRRNNVLSGK